MNQRMKQLHQQYHEESAVALRTKDPRVFQVFIRKYAYMYPPDMLKLNEDLDLVELAMHKMICVRKDLADLHQESGAWLKERDYHQIIRRHNP